VLALAGLLSAAGRRLGAVASALAVLAFGLGATKLLDHSLRRPDYQQAARYIRRAAGPGDVVLEAAILSPGPLTGLDAAGPLPVRVLRLGRPQERDHPFNIFDPVPSNASVSRRAGEQADGHRVFLVTTAKTLAAVGAEVRSALPPGYRAVSIRHYPGLLPLVVALYARS
jgi:hypothetical protein